MIAPIRKLKKETIVKLSDQRCLHGHTYLEHYQCYLNEQKEKDYKLGHLDIETSNLVADFGLILTWAIKDDASNTIIEGMLSKEDIDTFPAGCEDTRIVQELVTSMKEFDELTTWYGARFDIPFIRTRAQVCGVDFPKYGALKHKDLWFTCRGKFKLSSNRLENACRVLLGKTTKNRIDSKYWRGATRGDQQSLDYIADHNRRDVNDLQKIYKKIVEYGRPVSSSI